MFAAVRQIFDAEEGTIRNSILFLLLFSQSIASAGVFKCMTDDGQVTYSDQPCITGAAPYSARASVTNSASQTASVARGAGGVFRTTGSVDNTPVNFIVDTGATYTTLSSDAANSVGIRNCVPAGISETANGSTVFCRVSVKKLSFAGFNFVNLTVSVQPAMRGESLLGNDLLKQFTIRQQGDLMTLSR